MAHYQTEYLSQDDDDGTMPDNVAELEAAVVGRKIVSSELVTERPEGLEYGWNGGALFLTLDDGTVVQLHNTADCCAYTELEAFLLNPELVDHVILGVGTTDYYTTWHVYADAGDVLRLTVGWSSGNPFYYAYGFDIKVVPAVGGGNAERTPKEAA